CTVSCHPPPAEAAGGEAALVRDAPWRIYCRPADVTCCSSPRISQTRLCSPSLKLLLAITRWPALFTASFCISRPCRPPLLPPSGSRLPGTSIGSVKLCPLLR